MSAFNYSFIIPPNKTSKNEKKTIKIKVSATHKLGKFSSFPAKHKHPLNETSSSDRSRGHPWDGISCNLGSYQVV